MKCVSGALCLFLLLGGTLYVCGRYPSTTCSDEGCGTGIPCYLRPADDDCHYTDEDPCDGGDATALDQQLWLLNNSLVRLQEKLVQKGIIPKGKTCPPLPLIDDGGVIYTDLLLSVGVVANYVCNEGYSLHGHGRFECLDGLWIDDHAEQIIVKPTCEDSLIVCEALVPIPNGHVSYHIVDATKIQPGDVASYECDTLYTMLGDQFRVCLRNGTWTGVEPVCEAPIITTEPSRTEQGSSNNTVAIPVGVLVALVVLIALIALAVIVAIRIKQRSKKNGYAELDEKMQSLQATDSGAASRAETTKLLDEETPQEGVATLQAGQK